MPESDRKPGHTTSIAEQIHRSKGGDDRQRPQSARQAPANCAKRLARLSDKQLARTRIAAMLRAVGQRPEGSRALRLVRAAAEQPCADPKQDASPEREANHLSLAPRERLKQRQPCIFELGQLMSAQAPRQKLARDRLQARLRGGSRMPIEFVEPLAPPGQPDRAEPRVAARRHDFGKGKVEVPQRRKCGSDLARQLFERDLAVVVERPLSDR